MTTSVGETPKLELKPVTIANMLVEETLPARADKDTSVEEQQAELFVTALLSVENRDESGKRQAMTSIETLGAEVQKQLSRHNSKMLQAPAHLIAEAEDGGPVATTILDLQKHIADVNPNRINFSPGGFRALLSKLPFVGTPLSNWYAKYQTVEQVLNDICKNMEAGKKELENDNITLQDDQAVMRSLTYKLEDYILVARLVQDKLTTEIEAIPDVSPQKAFLQEKILFPLNQRIIDLQQQQAVNQQGYLSIEVIVENNKQLIRGVDRALNVTLTALGVAATLAIALKRQKKVLDATNTLNDTTGDLLVQTSENLKTQGVEIQKQASNANLDIEKVKTAFANVAKAVDDLASFRQDALGPMKESINEMSDLTTQMENSIKDVESGHAVEQRFLIQLETPAA